MNTYKSPSYFLLTHGYRDLQNRFEIILYGVSCFGKPAKVIIDNFRPLFFIPRNTPSKYTKSAVERKQLPLKSKNYCDVDCLYFSTYYKYLQCEKFLRQKAIQTFESDIRPVDRYLSERFVKGGFTVQGKSVIHNGIKTYISPKIRGVDCTVNLRVMSIDIETNGSTGEIYCIACYGNSEVVFISGSEKSTNKYKFCESEYSVINHFIKHIKNEDPDVIIGWNIINFDLIQIKKRCEHFEIPFEISRDYGTTLIPKREGSNQYSVRIPGRVVLDVPVMLRVNQYTFDQYSLNFVASELLGKTKEIELTGQEKINEINTLFQKDKFALAHYNLDDTKLTREIFDRTNLLANAVERSKHSGQLIDQMGGSVSSFDYLYLPLLHREGYVANNVSDVSIPNVTLTGGHVMDSKPGLYENVLLLDFKSLYPTIILSFYVDPLGAFVKTEHSVKGPSGFGFSRDKSILPGIIAHLLKAREHAKEIDNKPLSYAIKILMNSFYGVLGSPGCRFFSPDLASTITGTGQYILKKTKSYIEQTTPYKIIYGDTDSLFILLGRNFEQRAQEIGQNIVVSVNSWLKEHLKDTYQVESFLELEFESHFRHFFMPTIRGGTKGSKKRYCGSIEKNGELKLKFKGLEFVRSDWTAIAKEFQNTLYLRVFKGDPVDNYILSIVNKIRGGKLDSKLVYRKHLRKQLHEYTAHVPPHVQAARLLDKPENTVSYVITVDGPQPVQKITSKIDYEHYVTNQLQPIADSILEWIHLDFDTIITGQQNLF